MNDDKPKGVLRIVGSKPDVSHDPPPPIARKPMRSNSELEPLAKQVAANVPLLNKFRATIGCEDQARMRDMIDEVRNYARSIDPALTHAEGATIALLLSNIDDSGSPLAEGCRKMNERLESMWREINREFFGDELKPLAEIAFAETSGSGGIGAHGKFFDKSRCIAIDEKFKFDEEAIRGGSAEETNKVELAYRVLMHEMVHQALFERGAEKPGGHGEMFLAEAQRISKQMGEEPPTPENVVRWPLHLIGAS
ncbi:hypothetical protein [Bradyrhizobium diazoefficiens]